MKGFDVINTSNIGIGTSDPGTASLAVMNGNVGIGTTGPGAKLDVMDTMRLTSSDTSYRTTTFRYGGRPSWPTYLMSNQSANWYSGLTLNHYYTGANVYTYSGSEGTWKGAAAVLFKHDASILFQTNTDGTSVAPTTRMSIDNTGNVAINTNQLYVQQSSGNVGIGTTGPAAKLDIKGAGDSTEIGRAHV